MTTCIESTIHYPTDSSLLGDGVRVLSRSLARIAQQCKRGTLAVVNHGRAVKYRLLEISQAISPDILHFPARVLVRGGNELEHAATLFPSRVSADLLVPRAIPHSPGFAPGCYKPVAVRSDSRSTLHGHAAAHG